MAAAHPSLFRQAGTALAALALLAGCGRRAHRDSGPTAAADPAAVPNSQAALSDASDGQDWPGYGRTLGEQHFSPLTQVDATNVARLGLAWSYDLPAGNSVTAPIEVGGTLYLASGYSVVSAIDVASGRLLWSFDPRATLAAGAKLRGGWGSRGLAWWDGKIYIGTQDGRLIAIDGASGRPLWSRMTLDRDEPLYIDSPPRAFDGMILIGASIGDVGSQGIVSAYDAATGQQLWRFTTVPGDSQDDPVLAAARASWGGGEGWRNGGGAVSNAIACDPATGTVFIGTGPGTPWNRHIRSGGQGDDLFTSAIIALDARTGAMKWQHQLVPGDAWGYGATADIELMDLTLHGVSRPVLVSAGAGGFVTVLDRRNGALISATPFAATGWASGVDPRTGRPVEQPGSRYDAGAVTLSPSPLGAHGRQPMALSPAAGLVFVPFTDLQATYDPAGMTAANWQPAGGFALDHGVRVTIGPRPKAKGEGGLVAWNPLAKAALWRITTPSPASGGVLATGGGLVFQGRIDGQFAAYRTRTGKRLWSFAAQAPVIAPPISYAVGGRQYVTVVTGFTGPFAQLGAMLAPWGIDYATQQRRVLTFAIGGTQALPSSANTPAKPIADPNFAPDAEATARGAGLYAQRCASCHGIDAIAAGAAPDLRRAASILSYEEFDTILRDGMLEADGMPRYGELDSMDRQALREYLRTRADDLRHGR